MTENDRQEKSNYLESQQEIIMNRLRALQKSTTLSQHTTVNNDSLADISSLSAAIRLRPSPDIGKYSTTSFVSENGDEPQRTSSPATHHLGTLTNGSLEGFKAETR